MEQLKAMDEVIKKVELTSISSIELHCLSSYPFYQFGSIFQFQEVLAIHLHTPELALDEIHIRGPLQVQFEGRREEQ